MPSDTASSGVEAWKGKKHTSPRVQLWTLPPHCKTGSALQCLSGCVYCVLPRLPPIRSLTLLDNHAVAVPPSLPGWLRGAPEVMLLRDSSAPSTSQALPAVLCKREAVMHTVCPRSLSDPFCGPLSWRSQPGQFYLCWAGKFLHNARHVCNACLKSDLNPPPPAESAPPCMVVKTP